MNTKKILNDMLSFKEEDRLRRNKVGEKETAELVSFSTFPLYTIFKRGFFKILPPNKVHELSEEFNVLSSETKDFFTFEDLSNMGELLAKNESKDMTDNAILLVSDNKYQRYLLDASKKDFLYLSIVSMSFKSEVSTEDNFSHLAYIKVKVTKKDDGFIIEPLSKNIIFNDLLTEYLKSKHDIDITYHYNNFDMEKYIKFIQEKAQVLHPFVYKRMFLTGENVVRKNLILHQNKYLNKESKYFASAIRAIDNEDALGNKNEVSTSKPVEISKHSKEVRQVEEIDEYLNKNGVVKVNVEDPKFYEFIFERLFTKYLYQNKKILYLTSNKENKLKLCESFNKLGYKNIYYSGEFNGYSMNILKALIDVKANKIETVDGENAEKINKFLQIKKDFLEMEKLRKSAYNFEFGDSYLSGLNKASYYVSRSCYFAPIDVALYNDDDYALDQVFFSNLKGYSVIVNRPLSTLPFYGISLEDSSLSYEEIIETSQRVIDALNAVYDYIAEVKIPSWGIGMFTSLTTYREFKKTMDKLEEYDGFNLDYFTKLSKNYEITYTVDNYNALDEECEKVRTKLYSFVKDTEFLESSDLVRLIKGFKQKEDKELRKKSKKEIKSHLKFKLFGFFRFNKKITNEFIDNLEQIINCRKVLLNTFGELVNEKDGIHTITRYVHYVNDIYVLFNKLKKEEHYNPESDFLREFFTDGAIRREIINEVFYKLHTLMEEYEASIKNYRNLLTHDKSNFEDMTMDEMKKIFVQKLQTSEQGYGEYKRFLRDIEKTSDCLKKFFEEYNSNNLLLNNLEESFFSSLFKTFNDKCLENFKGKEVEYMRLKSDYVSSLKLNQKLLKIYETNDYRIARKEFLNSDFLRERIATLRNTYTANFIPNGKSILNAISNVYQKVFPITISTLENLELYEDYKFDICVIEDSASFSDRDLLLALTFCKKNVVVNYPKHPEVRLNYYPLVRLNYGSLLVSPFKFNVLMPSVFNIITSQANLHNYVLKNNCNNFDPLFPPLYLSFPGDLRARLILLPDCLYDEDEIEFVEYNLRSFILNMYNDIIVTFSAMNLVYNPDSQFEDIGKIYSVYLQNVRNAPESTAKSNQNKDDIQFAGIAEDYRRKLISITNSFEEYRGEEYVDILLEGGDLDLALESLLPCRREVIDSFNRNDFSMYVDSKIKDRELKDVNGTICYFDLFDNRFRKSNHTQRTIESVSVIEMVNGIYRIVRGFEFIESDELKQTMANLLDTESTNPLFEKVYVGALNYLKKFNYIKEESGRISLSIIDMEELKAKNIEAQNKLHQK